MLELKAEREVRVIGQRLLAELDVVGRDELAVLPASALGEAVAETGGVGGAQGDGAGTVGMGHRDVAAVEAVAPRTPAHRLAEFLVDVGRQFLTCHAAEDHRGDVRSRRRVGIAFARSGPERHAERGAVDVTDILSLGSLERLGRAADDAGGRRPFSVMSGRHAEQVA